MRAVPAARLWLLLGLLLSVTLGLYQIAHRSALYFGLDAGEDLHDRVTVLRDPGGRLGVEDVATAWRKGDFLRPEQPDLMYGYTRDVIWIHLSLASDGERYLEVSPPRLADVRLYVRGSDGRFRERRSGLEVPVAEREVRVRQAVFALQPGTDLRETYVRIASQNAILVDLRLWEPLRFLETARHIDLLNGLQFGALLLFALYAFATAAALRESTYAWFGLTLLAYALYDISILQYGYQYLWPSGGDWALRSAGVFLAVAVFGLGQLVAGLLQAPLYLPGWNRVLRGLGFVALAYIPGMATGDYSDWVQWLNYVALLQLLFTISATLLAIFRGQQGAALLLAAFLLLWFTSLLRMGQILGVLPHTLLADYSQGWSMVVGGLLMAMTQAERLRRAHAEQDIARLALVEAQTNARENAERAVEERTRELLVAKDAAEASSRAKSAFLAQLSHELRTPLHSILGYSGLMRDDAVDPEAQRRLDAIRRSGIHLLALIDSLLDYARGEAGRLQLALQAVRLRPFLDSIGEETRAFADAAGMTLDIDCADDVPDALRLDATRLRQVISNLIVNACRHSHGRHIVLEARSGQLADGACGLLLTVRDDGVGIAPADRERIFQPFEQGGEGSAGKGIGLGLAISRQLVTLMGGELVLEPQSPGCRFCLRLTAERVELPPEPMPVMAGGVEGPVPGTGFSPPSQERLAELRKAAEEGRISDIEDWVDAIRESEPGASAFAAAVLAALRRLDLAAIRRMTE